MVLLIAPDMKQAKVLLDYAEGMLQSTPLLKQLILARTKDTLVLTTGITLGSSQRIVPAHSRYDVRGGARR